MKLGGELKMDLNKYTVDRIPNWTTLYVREIIITLDRIRWTTIPLNFLYDWLSFPFRRLRKGCAFHTYRHERMSSWTKKTHTWILSMMAYGFMNNSADLLLDPMVVIMVAVCMVTPLNIILYIFNELVSIIHFKQEVGKARDVGALDGGNGAV